MSKKQFTNYQLHRNVYVGTKRLLSRVVQDVTVDDTATDSFYISDKYLRIHNDNDMCALFGILATIIVHAFHDLCAMFNNLFGNTFASYVLEVTDYAEFAPLEITHILRPYKPRENDVFVQRKNVHVPTNNAYAVVTGKYYRTLKSGRRVVGLRVQYDIPDALMVGIVDIAIDAHGNPIMRTWRPVAFYNTFVHDCLGRTAQEEAGNRSNRHTVEYDLVRGARGISASHTS